MEKPSLRAPALFSVCLATVASCYSGEPQSVPIGFWALKPATLPLPDVTNLTVAADLRGPSQDLARWLHDDLLASGRYEFSGRSAEARLEIAAGAITATDHLRWTSRSVFGAACTRYWREVSQRIEAELTVVDTGTQKALGPAVKVVANDQRTCGDATVPGDANASVRGQDLFGPIEACSTDSLVARVGRQLTQALVPHYERQSVQLYTDPLPQAEKAAEHAAAGEWDAAERLLLSDIADVESKGASAELRAKANYNLAAVMHAQGNAQRTSAFLLRATHLRGQALYQQITNDLIDAQVAMRQAAAQNYTPHRLPSL